MHKDDKDISNQAGTSDGKDENANLRADITLQDASSPITDSKNDENASPPTSNETQQKVIKSETNLGASSSPTKKGNKNALLHGVYSHEVIMPWENEDDFKTLHQAFRMEWNPRGYSEEQCVLDVTYYTWMKWRAIKAAQLRFFKTPLAGEIKPGEDTWETMIEYQKKLGASGDILISRAYKFMQDLNATFEHIRSHHYWTEDSEGKEIQKQLGLLKTDVSRLTDEVRTKVIDGVGKIVDGVKEANSCLDQAYDLDEIERQLNLVAKFDVSIEKVLRRLTSIKVFKRVDGVDFSPPALIESPSVAPDENSGENNPQQTATAQKLQRLTAIAASLQKL